MSDALERLKNRARPEVPNRDATLTSESSESRVPESQDTSIPRNLDLSKLKARIKPLETKQSTIRLESNLSGRLQKVCRASAVSREVLIEAMFEYCEQNPEALNRVMESAEMKNSHRQQIANLKRAKSMMQKFS
ncbi:MAG: hypothetical protein ACFCU8_14280 [Thermosynechococcaceae cyanobacterium]